MGAEAGEGQWRATTLLRGWVGEGISLHLSYLVGQLDERISMLGGFEVTDGRNGPFRVGNGQGAGARDAVALADQTDCLLHVPRLGETPLGHVTQLRELFGGEQHRRGDEPVFDVVKRRFPEALLRPFEIQQVVDQLESEAAPQAVLERGRLAPRVAARQDGRSHARVGDERPRLVVALSEVVLPGKRT